jgi:hypothetical protein
MRRLGGEQSELRKSCARGSIWWLHPDISEPVRWHHKQPKKTGERDFNREIERTGGRVLSNAPMAILNPAPSPKRTFSLGTRTSSNVIPRVSEALCPMFISFLPGVTPGVSLSTMKPVKALAGEHFGSGLVRAKTKYQLATLLAIENVLISLFLGFGFDAVNIGTSARFRNTIRLKTSVVQFCYIINIPVITETNGSSISRPRYFFCCSLVPAIITGTCCGFLFIANSSCW